MVILFICIIILLFYIYTLHSDRNMYDKFTSGFWKADNSYCTEADIDDMVFYINCCTNTGHLIITKDNELIENSSFNIKKEVINNSNNLIPFNNILGNQLLEYNIEFISDNDFLWNDGKYSLKISIINGSMIIYKDETLFAKLYKDNGISNKFLEYAQIEETL
jgi:hypothetical protein